MLSQLAASLFLPSVGLKPAFAEEQSSLSTALNVSYQYEADILQLVLAVTGETDANVAL